MRRIDSGAPFSFCSPFTVDVGPRLRAKRDGRNAIQTSGQSLTRALAVLCAGLSASSPRGSCGPAQRERPRGVPLTRMQRAAARGPAGAIERGPAGESSCVRALGRRRRCLRG